MEPYIQDIYMLLFLVIYAVQVFCFYVPLIQDTCDQCFVNLLKKKLIAEAVPKKIARKEYGHQHCICI